MEEQTLAAFVKRHNQEAAADLMGLHQGTISKMLAAQRDIRLIFNGRKYSHYYEVKVGKSKH